MAIKHRLKKLEEKARPQNNPAMQIILKEDGELWTMDGSTLTQEEYDALDPEQIIEVEFIHEEVLKFLD